MVVVGVVSLLQLRDYVEGVIPIMITMEIVFMATNYHGNCFHDRNCHGNTHVIFCRHVNMMRGTGTPRTNSNTSEMYRVRNIREGRKV